MKKLVTCIALLGLAGFTACSGDSPSTPPVPTVVPSVWEVASLTLSDVSPFVNSVVLVDAVITRDGNAAPDGTPVEFLSSGGLFVAAKQAEVTVSTEDGVARVAFVATEAGAYVIQARVHDTTRQVTIDYREHTVDDSLEIYQPLIPNIGAFDGGETVIMNGKGIAAPVDVSFTVQGVVYPAIVQQVVESDPLSGPGSITVLTPFISAANRTVDQPADVSVTGGVGTSNQQTVTMASAFTFLTNVIAGGTPAIYAVVPNFGRSEGGDQVTILGRNFDDSTQVFFTFRNQDLMAQVLSVSPDGLQVLLSTPRFSTLPLDADELADVKVTTNGGESILAQGFVVLADEPQPTIASLSPIAGPLEGGTLVTIFGSGFQTPAQVQFGNLTALDVNVIDDPTPSDNDIITCVSPDYTQQGVTPPVSVNVIVTNMQSGKFSNAMPFTYGDILFISGNTPTEGRPGDMVILFGAGFEDPLQLFWESGSLELEVMNVSGTEILARFPADIPVTCSDTSAGFRVRLLETNTETTGGLFELLGNRPTVISVDPTFVQEINFGNGVDPSDVTIFGADFAEDLLVTIGSYVMPGANVTVVDPGTIEVTNIPAPNAFGLVFNTMSCITTDGLQGVRQAATPVNVTVTNIPGNCADTLVGGIIYEPEDTSCVAASEIQAAVPPFPAAQAGTCSTVDLTVSNTGAGDLQVYQLNLTGRFYFDGGASTQVNAGFTVVPFGSQNVPLYFCPDVDNGMVYSGNLAIQHSAPNQPNPWQIPLSAQEAFPVWGVSPLSFDFMDQTAGGGPYAFATPLTITNTGSGTLTWSLSVTGANPNFFWILEGPNGVVPAGTAVDYTVIFNPTAVQPYSAEFNFTAAEPDANPVSVGPISVSGNGI